MMKKLVLLLPLLLSASLVPAQPVWSDTSGVEQYFDGVINGYLNDNHIAGATLGMVKDNEPYLVKGYGFSDVNDSQLVDGKNTLFRIGSISKMFVWTAVMQLVEQDRLDLDEDVNRYLEDVEVPQTYEEPVTMRHLMTHSAGFEEYIIGLFAQDTIRVRPLEQILSEEMPARVRPPGEIASYSNHGTGIAALVVEQISGLSFEEYIRQNILDPLQMRNSSFRQPLPDSLEPFLSRGYRFEDGEFREKPFELVPMGPIGTASATAEDMLNFMQAHLEMGQFGDSAILDSTTAALMQRPAFYHHPIVNPMRHGFMDLSQNGVEIIGHGGDTFWFHSLMAIFPEHDFGLFISFNTEQGGGASGKILEQFVDQYFPEEVTAVDTAAFDSTYLQRFAGNYRANRYPHERLTKLMALMNSLPVTVTEDQKLRTMRDGEAQFWTPIDSLAFREVSSSETIAFKEGDSGIITHLFLDDLPIIAFEKVHFLSSQNLHFTLFGIAILIFLVILLYWPLAYFIRRQYRPSMTASEPLPLIVKTIAWLNALLLLVFYIGLAVALSGPESIVYGLATPVKILLIFPLLSVLLTLTMIYFSYRIRNRQTSGVSSRISYYLLTVIFAINIWQLYYWNLLGFNY